MKSYSTTWIKRPALLLALTLSFSFSFAQTDLISPYSIFGPGTPNLRQTVSQAGMGGSGIALFDPYKMNFSNPAIVAYHLEPIFETSVKATFSRFSTSASSFENKNLNINNISLSFPIRRGTWGFTVGLSPYSTVGYDVTQQISNDQLENDPKYNYAGDGGISQGYIGTGYKIYNKVDTAGNISTLAFGANFNYNFGTIDNNRRVTFPSDRSSSYALEIRESILLHDASGDFGIHYQTNLIKRTIAKARYLKLLVGATYSLGSELKAERNLLAYNFRGDIGLVGADTLAFEDGSNGFIKVPTKITAGLALDYISLKKSRIRFSLDYAQQEWSTYAQQFGGVAESFNFQDSRRISTGLEYTPLLGSTKYLNNVEYRLGFKYEQSNLNLRDTDIEDVGMSFGLSLPIHHRRPLTKSAFHLAAQFGRYGTENNGLIQEDYIRIYAGFSFTPHFRNRWFVQPKYD